jgi:hypothetical protein
MTTGFTALRALSVALLASLAVPTAARASDHYPVMIGDPGPEAAGCYFSRGRMYCGRYCYWEINGKRYCQRRERDAHPQGDVYIEESFVRPGSYRSRRNRQGGYPQPARHSERLK